MIWPLYVTMNEIKGDEDMLLLETNDNFRCLAKAQM